MLLLQPSHLLGVCLCGWPLLDLILVDWLNLEIHHSFQVFHFSRVKIFKIFPYNILHFFGIHCEVFLQFSSYLFGSSLFLTEPKKVNLVYLLKVRAVRFVLLLLTFALIFLISCLHLGLCLICSCVSHLCLLFVIFNVSSQSYNFVL